MGPAGEWRLSPAAGPWKGEPGSDPISVSAPLSRMFSSLSLRPSTSADLLVLPSKLLPQAVICSQALQLAVCESGGASVLTPAPRFLRHGCSCTLGWLFLLMPIQLHVEEVCSAALSWEDTCVDLQGRSVPRMWLLGPCSQA